MTAPAYAVEFRNATFAYGALAEKKHPVLEDVTFGIAPGQCVCLTGSSGCGKTTLTRLVNGLIPAFYEGERTGQVLIEGVELADWDMDDLCRAVGSVFQNPRSQFFNLDTTSELAYGCENLGLPRPVIFGNVAQAAEELCLGGLIERDIHDLSGGQRQLLALGTACAMGADIFVLDEPTANLDADATRAVKRTLMRLKGQGKTILIVEHRLHWLDGLAERVLLMDDGRIAGDWTADAFAALPTEKLASLGLRRWSLDALELGTGLGEKPRASAGTTAGKPSGDADASGRGNAAPRPAEPARAPHTPDPARAPGEPAPRTPSQPFSVQADGLRAGYRDRRTVLDGMSFSAAGGHAVAVIGRNGQGKSTLARVLAGLTRETYGGVSFDARPVPVRKRAEEVYLVLQESAYQLFGSTVHEELAIGMEPAADERELACDLLRRFGLEGKGDRHPASLSGGEKQRLACAVGVRSGARLLVLDEPTSGLDLANMRRCAQEIRRMADEGRCVMVVTHDAELVAAACDHVIEVADGAVRGSYALTPATLPRALALLAPETRRGRNRETRPEARDRCRGAPGTA